MPTIGIIGGGIAGLTAAYRLRQRGFDITVFEASDQSGGMIRSEHASGFLVEHGPNSLRAATPLMDGLIEELGLATDRVVAQPEAKNRYVVRDGVPRALPGSVRDFFTTRLLSWPARLRLLAEPFVSRPAAGTEETVAQFAQRRLGREVLDYGLNPFVAGVFAGDPERLSLRHAFPTLYELERKHGSLFVGMVRRALASSNDGEQPQRGIFSFENGLQQLPQALAQILGDRIRCGAQVTGLRRDPHRWILTAETADDVAEHAFDAVVCTVPLHRLAAMDTAPSLGLRALPNVYYPPVTLLHLGFRRTDVQHALDGFGVLVPAAESDIQILGTIFASSVFPARAPAGHVLLSTFVGGARCPALGRADVETQRDIVLRDLRRLLGVRGDPVLTRRIQWPQAIPQYTTGYGRVTARLDRLEAQHPRLAFAGNYRSGISVGDAMDSGASAARRLAAARRLGAAL